MDTNFIEQVAKLYLKYGIRSITMDDIARHLGISKKTIYQYVKDKEDLVSQVLEYTSGMDFDRLCGIRDQEFNPIDELIAFWEMDHEMCNTDTSSFSFDLFKYYPHLIKPIIKKRQTKILGFLEKNFQKGIDMGIYREDLDVFLISRIMIVTMETLLDSKVFDLNYILQPTFPKKLGKFYIQGIISDQGRQYFKEKFESQ